ncbi:MAG TPA: hypothetical protein VIE63_13265 [Ramlibacter sp.]|jgi:hypothetical protein
MKSVIPKPPPWSAQTLAGAAVVVALLAALALTFLLGGPGVSSWLFSH